ncbi:unnamed protein product, partial [Rotaria magnacalcarata]
LHRL